MRKALATGLILVLLLAGSSSARGIQEGGTFRVGLGGGFGSIDPLYGPLVLSRPTCAGLMRLEGFRVVPEVAASLPKVTNGKTYTFTIRKGVRFSTGSPVIARSVAHTINRLLHPKMQAAVVDSFDDILGAQKVIDGKAETASGIVARGDTLIIRLKKPVGDFLARLAGDSLCVVPETTPIDPEGMKAPVPGAGPYYVAEYVLGQRVRLERNRFYRGDRPHHVDRFLVDLTGDVATVLDRVDRGELDYGTISTQDFAARAAEFRRKYGINKSRFWVMPANNLRMFVLNTTGPLFRNNVQLRQAVNFAVDRRRLLRERGPFAGTLTDQYLPPGMPGFRNERIYPLEKPDLERARALARGRTRTGKAVLYTVANPVGVAQAEIVKDNLGKIGIDVEIKQFPAPVLFGKLATPEEPFDIGWIGWQSIVDGSFLNDLFDGRTIGQPGFRNWSYFNSPTYNRLLEGASRLRVGPERYRRYGELDVDIARNAAPAIPFAYDNELTLVSARTGCVVVNPHFDLAAVCLK